jgi:ribosomal protein S18 acetylase RimI-like enzyme
MIRIREMDPSEIGRIAEIDRSEHVTTGYTYERGRLRAGQVDWRVPRWPEEGDGFSVKACVEHLAPILDNGGVMLGAFDRSLLVGFAVLRYRLTERQAELVALHVSKGYRRRGIAARLTSQVIGLARADGAEELYVSATPSESAVGFYLSKGFRLAEEVNEALYALEPEDIHMIRRL